MVGTNFSPGGAAIVDGPVIVPAAVTAEVASALSTRTAANYIPASNEEERPDDYLLSVVVPVYNEQLVAREFVMRLTAVLKNLKCRYEVIFVDDGSKDTSLAILEDERTRNSNIRIVSFARNFGHQVAITAGMDHARGHAVVTMDADLQDPPELLPDLLAKWKAGDDVVYAKRRTRAGETLFKKWTASSYYRLLRKLTDVDVPVDTGDFRLMSRAAIEAFSRVRERHRYLRGLVSWLGFKQSFVEYDRDKRFAGKSNYRFSRSVRLSIDGITSFSVLPLRFATICGIVLTIVAFLFMAVALFSGLLFNAASLPWCAVLTAVLLIGGLQLICIGIVGEYLGVVHEESKRRPLYVIREVLE